MENDDRNLSASFEATAGPVSLLENRLQHVFVVIEDGGQRIPMSDGISRDHSERSSAQANTCHAIKSYDARMKNVFLVAHMCRSVLYHGWNKFVLSSSLNPRLTST